MNLLPTSLLYISILLCHVTRRSEERPLQWGVELGPVRPGKPYGKRPWYVVRGMFECLMETVETFLLGWTCVHDTV